MIRAINNRHLGARMAEMLAEREAAKSSAEDDYLSRSGLGHKPSVASLGGEPSITNFGNCSGSRGKRIREGVAVPQGGISRR